MQVALDQPGTHLTLRQPHESVGTFVAQGIDTAAAVDQAELSIAEFLVQGPIKRRAGYLIGAGYGQRPVVANANGTWFIWVVASQSVATSAASLEPVFPSLRDGLAIAAVFS